MEWRGGRGRRHLRRETAEIGHKWTDGVAEPLQEISVTVTFAFIPKCVTESDCQYSPIRLIVGPINA